MTFGITKKRSKLGLPWSSFVAIGLMFFVSGGQSKRLDAQQLKPLQTSSAGQQPAVSAPGLEFEEPSSVTPASSKPVGKSDRAVQTGVAASMGLVPLRVSDSGSQSSKKTADKLPIKGQAAVESVDVAAASFLSQTNGLGTGDGVKSEGDFVQAVFELPNPNQPAKPAPTLEDVELAEQSLAGGEFGKAVQSADALQESIEGEKSLLDTLVAENLYDVATEPYRRYRTSEASLTHLAGSSRSFGWTSMEWEPYLKRAQTSGLTGSVQHHFLSGPRDVDLPSRLHDFILGYQQLGSYGAFSFDCAASVGVFSDFQGSAREGVRFPAHAVGIIHASHRADLVFGVDYLGRDDYKILPVLGISWHDLNFASLRYDLVFPRPRIDYTIDDGQRVYLAGRLGGGTWDFESPDGSGDVMNYRDFRILLGHEQRYLNGSRHALEFGYVFGRQLTVRETPVEFDFRNAFIIRLLSTY